MPRLEGEELEDTVVLQRETVDRAPVGCEAEDGTSHGGVCERGSVPKKVSVVVEVAAHVRD